MESIISPRQHISNKDNENQNINQLNQERKALLLELKESKKQRNESWNELYNYVYTLLPDYALKYFSQDGEFANKPFSKRYEAAMKSLKLEVKQLEEQMGVRMGDIDDEFNIAMEKLQNKEEEFIALQKRSSLTISETEVYQDMMKILVDKDLIQQKIQIDYLTLPSLIERKEIIDQKLSDISTKREEQLVKEVRKLQDYLLTSSRNKNKGILEVQAKYESKQLRNRDEEKSKEINQERDNLFQRFLNNEQKIHESYLQKYEALQRYLIKQNSTPLQASIDTLDDNKSKSKSKSRDNYDEDNEEDDQENSINEDYIKYDRQIEAIFNEVDILDPRDESDKLQDQPWKTEVLDQYDKLLITQLEWENQEKALDQITKEQLQSPDLMNQSEKDTSNSLTDRMYIQDIANKLSQLYLKYNENYYQYLNQTKGQNFSQQNPFFRPKPNSIFTDQVSDTSPFVKWS